MTVLEFQTQVDAPPEKVFAYISDLEKHVGWSGGQAITKTSEGPVGAGSTYETQEEGPFDKTLKEKVDVIHYHASERVCLAFLRAYGALGLTGRLSFALKTEARSWPNDSISRRASSRPSF